MFFPFLCDLRIMLPKRRSLMDGCHLCGVCSAVSPLIVGTVTHAVMEAVGYRFYNRKPRLMVKGCGEGVALEKTTIIYLMKAQPAHCAFTPIGYSSFFFHAILPYSRHDHTTLLCGRSSVFFFLLCCFVHMPLPYSVFCHASPCLALPCLLVCILS